MNERELIDKLKRIQALHRGATTEGERIAAERAYERVHHRLEQHRSQKPQAKPVSPSPSAGRQGSSTAAVSEFQFSLSDRFSRRLFTALARRHGLRPFRYKRQRSTTVMLRASPQFIDDVFWPEFEQLGDTLDRYLDQITDRVIAQAVHGDASEAAIDG